MSTPINRATQQTVSNLVSTTKEWARYLMSTEVIFIAAATLLAGLASEIVLGFLRRSKYINKWIKSFFDALHTPLFWFIIVYGLKTILITLFDFAKIEAGWLEQARSVFVLLTIAWIFFRWKKRIHSMVEKIFLQDFSDRTNRTLFHALNRLVTIVFISGAILVGLDILGVPLSALLTLGGVGGLAASWAAKDFVANFFGGLMIFINRPFIEGDYVVSSNKSFKGLVDTIGWYMTTLKTSDGTPLHIPNSLITGAIIENRGSNRSNS